MSMPRVGPRLFGPRKVALAELTDEELRAELEARRRRRSGGAGTAEAPARAKTSATTHPASTEAAGPPPAAAPPRQVRQWLANLELTTEATSADVEVAYERLLARYGPAARDTDAKRRATANALLGSLKQAYDGVQRYLSRVR